MKYYNCRLVPGLLLAGLLSLVANSAYARSLPDFVPLVEQNSAAVVNISTTQKVQTSGLPPGMQIPDMPEGSPFGELFKHFFGEGDGMPREFDSQSLGSGFVISADGYVLTNFHVVKDADEVIVRLSDRRQLEAKVVGGDARSDVALLKVEANDLPVARIGKSSELKVGEWVLAIGSPFGFDHSATAGIVSAKGRSLPRENYVPFIQTDVAINPGNSGGPLFNLDGEVVGVNSQIYSRTGGYMGLSFAIPIEVAMDVAHQLQTKGKVSRGWLGVLIQDVTRELAESFGMKRPRGALVAKVLPDSPAEKAGFQTGDVIIEFDDKQVDSSSSLPPIVGASPIDERIEVRIIRNGKERTLNVTLGELPEEEEVKLAAADKEAPVTTNRVGVAVADLSAEERSQHSIEAGGVMVRKVDKGAAADAGIRTGDVITSVDNVEVKDAKQFQKLIDGLKAGTSVAVLVQRGDHPMFVAMKVPAEQ